MISVKLAGLIFVAIVSVIRIVWEFWLKELIFSSGSTNIKTNASAETSEKEIRPEPKQPDFERDKTSSEPKIVMLRLVSINENKEENIKKLSEISGISEEDLTTIVNKNESLTDEEYDKLSDEEQTELTPIIKKGLTMQEAKTLHSELKELGILSLFDTEY